MSAPLVVEATAKHTATVLILHGLGDSGHGWLPVADSLKSALPHIKWLLPNAPSRPVTLNGGYRMPAWYDLYSLSGSAREDEAGLAQSAATVGALVEKEVEAGIAGTRIVVAGFSQGGALALYSGLTMRTKLAGIVGLSTYLPLHAKVQAALGPNKDTPVLMCHGEDDEVVQHQWGKASADRLKEMAINVTFKSYPDMGHSSSPRELRDLVAFLKTALP